MVYTPRIGGDPELFGDAMRTLLEGGLLDQAAEPALGPPPDTDRVTDPWTVSPTQDRLPGLDWDEDHYLVDADETPDLDPNLRALVTAQAVHDLPWSDRPRSIIEATDAIDPSESRWDEPAVRAAATALGRLLGIARPRVEVVTHPRAAFERWRLAVQGDSHVDEDGFVALEYDGPLSTVFGHQEGFALDDFWESLQPGLRPEDPLRTGLRTRGYTLWAHTRFDQVYGGMFSGRYPQDISVAWQIVAYLKLLLKLDATFVDTHWLPARRHIDKFAVEFRIGSALVDAFVAGVGFIVPVGDTILVVPRPVLRIIPEQPDPRLMPRYHHDAGPAAEFGDGTGVYFLHGVSLPEWLHLAIVEGALTMRHVRLMTDSDLRMAAIQSLPPHALLDGVDHDLVDVGIKGTRLHRIDDLPDLDGPAWYMVMTDPSTGREYGEFVPPEVGARGSADAAQAAAWGISVEDYLRMSLEG